MMYSMLRASFGVAALSLGLSACASQVGVHDPVMAKEGNTYYLFSTGPGITFYSSTDMKAWKPEGRVFAGEPEGARKVAPTFDGHLWAPDISFHNGKYYLYYSVSAFGKNTSAIGLTTNATLDPRAPGYKWQDQGIVLRSYPERDEFNAIDPNIVEDASGDAWMVFGSFWTGIKMFKLNAERAKPAEPQQWHSLARRAAPALQAGEKAPPEEIEGPHILKKNGYYYLFVSWGLCCKGKDNTYHVAVGRSKEVTGPYLDKTGKDMAKGGGSLVIVPNQAWNGVGHNSAYTFDGKDYMVLHAYETADRYKQKLKVLAINWDKDGWPAVDPADLDRYQSAQLSK
jgi:arabinan endo-1,5-alpha-L-arabinosidase